MGVPILSCCLLMASLAPWVAAMAAEPAGCPKVVVSADPDYPPLHWYDGKELRGPSVELAARILSDLQIPYEVRYVGPWKRVLATASAGKRQSSRATLCASTSACPGATTVLTKPATRASSADMVRPITSIAKAR